MEEQGHHTVRRFIDVARAARSLLAVVSCREHVVPRKRHPFVGEGCAPGRKAKSAYLMNDGMTSPLHPICTQIIVRII